MKSKKTLQTIALGLIIFHTLTVILHSIAHQVLPVKPTPAQLAFVVPVIIFAPVIAGFLIWKSKTSGVWLMTISLAGSFFFGLYYHFIAHTIDHISHVAELQPPFWSSTFIITAYLLAFGDFLGAIYGAFLIKQQ